MRSDIIIPVHNGANFIKKCVESALDVSALTGSSVIVSVNNCSDDTENILSKFNNKNLIIIKPDKFLSGIENLDFCLSYSTAEYVISIGADDMLNKEGQYEIYSYITHNINSPAVVFGYDEIIDVDDVIRRTHEDSLHWKNLDDNKIIFNSFTARNPNLNGAWVKKDLYRRFLDLYSHKLSCNAFVRVSDLYFWNFVCSSLLISNNLKGSFIYIHTPSIYYREYFEKKEFYRNIKIENNAIIGRSNYILDSIRMRDTHYSKHTTLVNKAIKVYLENNLVLLKKSLDSEKFEMLMSELYAQNLLSTSQRLLCYFNSDSVFVGIIFFGYGVRGKFKAMIGKLMKPFLYSVFGVKSITRGVHIKYK